jgi:hypothetical protein
MSNILQKAGISSSGEVATDIAFPASSLKWKIWLSVLNKNSPPERIGRFFCFLTKVGEFSQQRHFKDFHTSPLLASSLG